jgi:hypothetical protein
MNSNGKRYSQSQGRNLKKILIIFQGMEEEYKEEPFSLDSTQSLMNFITSFLKSSTTNKV